MKTKQSRLLLMVLLFITNIAQANEAPFADAGADQMVSIRDSVTLKGMGSHDPSGALLLTFYWEFVREEPVSGDIYSMIGLIDMSEPDNQGPNNSDNTNYPSHI